MSNSIYLALPEFMQNLGLSLYGASLYGQRFNGGVPDAYQFLSLFDEADLLVFQKQEKRLRELISHCKEHVPYYERFLRSVDVSKIKVSDLTSLVPVLTKADVLANAELLVSRSPSFRNKLRIANTSGSSGTPLCIYYTDESRRINYRFYEAALRVFGCSYRSKSTTLAGRVLYKDAGNSPARYDYFNRTQYLSSYFISPKTIHAYVGALNCWKPEFIDSYPSTIFELVNLAKSEGLEFCFSPKCVLTSSETLTYHCRKTIEEAFNTSVIDQYGCTEMAINAVSVGENYFANPLYSVIELEHEFDNSYGVITTGLLNFGMPLLRYKIGDLVEKPPASNGYIFSKIEGRLDDVITTPDGRRIGRMDPAFKGIEGVAMSQIVQLEIDLLCVFVVLDKKNNLKFDKNALTENIKNRTSDEMKVDIRIVESIERGANGKFKSVVSHVKA